MKYLIPCLLFVSNLAFGQAVQYAANENLHWTHGQTITLTYSPALAPPQVPHEIAIQTLTEVANRLNGLALPGLQIALGNLNLPNACDHRARNTVHVCWGPRGTRRADPFNYPMSDGTSFWREGMILLGNQVDWNDASKPFKQQIYHYLLHVIGFGHPDRTAGAPPSVVNNVGNDLQPLDIDGLVSLFRPGRCALTYDEHGTVFVPFVTYGGRAYSARLQYQGNGEFTIVPGSLGMYSATNLPITPCQNLAINSANEFHVPEVWVGGALRSATLQFTNGRLVLRQ